MLNENLKERRNCKRKEYRGYEIRRFDLVIPSIFDPMRNMIGDPVTGI